MSDEGKRRPPPRFPRPADEDRGIPPTDRVPVNTEPPPTERLFPRARPEPQEPFRLLTVEEKPRASWLIPSEFRDKIEKMIAGHNQVLTTQRNMALQLDGYGKAVNERFDIFHRELAMLRATVVDNDQRLDKVELTLAQKAKAVGGVLTRGAAFTFVGGVAAEAFPQYARFIAGLLRAVGASP